MERGKKEEQANQLEYLSSTIKILVSQENDLIVLRNLKIK